ncbi:Ser/Thr protein kinase RdoA (MazF antagonist) [Paenibacillus rhizosphaerae]|uniref:Ser/Thr protein kinase RdoA (MazF antagonist) n=1 Tax=Paenibacillus rhizosphaerae TaxID=297318 RepID=A0A839TKF4_9BACL|nr:phosphotransferase [Paenibacillus rhizosphaerae]MBB3127256.1 Ser/Thr protein kinase RdoA (MazF antagonist) [Paenibacillus rhizosphaerae]
MEHAIIAQHALAQYDINVVSVSPVAQSGAAVFKIEDYQGLLYSLRVHISKISTLEKMWTRRDVLDSELVWLDALNRGTSLTLPVPKRNRQGSYVTQVDDISCTMLSWVEGEQKQYFTSDQELKSTAEMTAALHHHAREWQPPSSFIRPTVHRERIQNALDLVKQQVQGGLLDAHDVQILEAAGEKAMALLDTLPKTKLTWGVLHGDIVPTNIVFVEGAANPIDFGACGFGPFLTDLAITFTFIHPHARQQYMDWYGEHFPLPNDSVAQIEALFISLMLIGMRNALGMPESSHGLPTHVQKCASREFGRYANGEHFLFTGTPFWE